MTAESSADLGEGQRVGVDALHRREQVPPARMRGLGAGDPGVLENTTEKKRALRGRVAAIPDGVIGARLPERAIDGAPRVARELRGDSSEVAPAHSWWLVPGDWWSVNGGRC